MEQQHDFSEVLEVASIAGHILLENGAEISRVEDIMARISTYFGVDRGNFFVLSNGIFTTGSAGKVEKAGGQASTYANVEFIPIRPIQLQKVVLVNQLSYDISAGKCSLEEARTRLEKIRSTPAKPMWEQTLGSAFGAAGFCAVFGGGWLDCGAAFVVGLLLNVFVFLVSGRYMSRIVGGISNALVATLLCVGCYHIGFGNSLANIIIGAIMPLIPGVPFVNGVRDLANADYLAGLTRLTDALLGFFLHCHRCQRGIHAGRRRGRRSHPTEWRVGQSRDGKSRGPDHRRFCRHNRLRGPFWRAQEAVCAVRYRRCAGLAALSDIVPESRDVRCHGDTGLDGIYRHPLPGFCGH